jgi:hypothetical protein
MVWQAIPDELLIGQRSGGWQKNTKDCQRFLTGEKVLNNKLDIKLHSNAQASKPKGLGVVFNKSLSSI